MCMNMCSRVSRCTCLQAGRLCGVGSVCTRGSACSQILFRSIEMHHFLNLNTKFKVQEVSIVLQLMPNTGVFIYCWIFDGLAWKSLQVTLLCKESQSLETLKLECCVKWRQEQVHKFTL